MTSNFLVEQNNKTLAFLQAQDFASAIDSASYALRHHKVIVQDAPPESACHNENSDLLDQCMLLTKINEPTNNDDVDAHQCDFIYEHGIVLHPSVKDDPTIVTAILLFNTALVHHLAVQAGHVPTTRGLQKARRLYELAYKSQNMEFNVLFQFALINNLAMIDRKLGNQQTSTKCMEYLMQLLMVLLDAGCPLRRQHVQGFLANLLSLPCASAAAA